MGRGFSPLFDAFAKKKAQAFGLSKMYFEAGLFSTPIVIVAGERSETGCGILLSESLTALTACGIGTDVPFLEGSDLGRVGGRFVRILHRGISIWVVR